ncbi:SDR family NAD(P)-dependent oxidoreductase [Brevibacterium sp. PAMC21349]|nr:SDR family NAD(P)-dependent oxidoreductase [Brevibacterium sp. PAMC21349]
MSLLESCSRIGLLDLITGASSGIGEVTAKYLASKKAKIVLGSRREDKLKAVANLRCLNIGYING